MQNRSFEYPAKDNAEWHALTSWELVEKNGGSGSIAVMEAPASQDNDSKFSNLNGSVIPLHRNNPHFAVLTVGNGGEGVGLANSGYGGIVVHTGYS